MAYDTQPAKEVAVRLATEPASSASPPPAPPPAAAAPATEQPSMSMRLIHTKAKPPSKPLALPEALTPCRLALLP